MNRTILAPGIILYNDLEKANKLINQFKNDLNDRWETAEVVDTSDYSLIVSKNRTCQEVSLFLENKEDQDLFNNISDFIDEKIEDYRDYYSIEEFNPMPAWLALKYENGGKFDWHIDDGVKYPRTVSVSAYLNDDFDGGEIEFLHFGISHKPKAGDIIVFSSAFPYMHRVLPTTNGTRYTIVRWYEFKELRW